MDLQALQVLSMFEDVLRFGRSLLRGELALGDGMHDSSRPPHRHPGGPARASAPGGVVSLGWLRRAGRSARPGAPAGVQHAQPCSACPYGGIVDFQQGTQPTWGVDADLDLENGPVPVVRDAMGSVVSGILFRTVRTYPWEPFRIEMELLRDLDPATDYTITLPSDTRTHWGALLGGFDRYAAVHDLGPLRPSAPPRLPLTKTAQPAGGPPPRSSATSHSPEIRRTSPHRARAAGST